MCILISEKARQAHLVSHPGSRFVRIADPEPAQAPRRYAQTRRAASGLDRHGLCCADLKPFMSGCSDSYRSRQLHRLRWLGVNKRVACSYRSYRYYLTRLGRAAIAAACFLTQLQIISALALDK